MRGKTSLKIIIATHTHTLIIITRQHSHDKVGHGIVGLQGQGAAKTGGHTAYEPSIILHGGEDKGRTPAPPLRQGQRAFQGPLILSPCAVIITVVTVIIFIFTANREYEAGFTGGVGGGEGSQCLAVVPRGGTPRDGSLVHTLSVMVDVWLV